MLLHVSHTSAFAKLNADRRTITITAQIYTVVCFTKESNVEREITNNSHGSKSDLSQYGVGKVVVHIN